MWSTPMSYGLVPTPRVLARVLWGCSEASDSRQAFVWSSWFPTVRRLCKAVVSTTIQQWALAANTAVAAFCL